MEFNILQKILRTIAAAMRIPVMIILILFIAFSAFCIGWIIAEYFRERRHMDYSLPALLDKLKSGSESLTQTIESSGLLIRQKSALLELTKHPDFSEDMLNSLADNIIEKEQSHYDRVLSITNLISKLAPMAGLLGTLIPLGPGIIALGNGDTMTLSESMLTAFDTTIAGLISAGVCLIHTIRKRWYEGYMSDIETLVDSVVNIQLENRQDSRIVIPEDMTEEEQLAVAQAVYEQRKRRDEQK